MAHDMTQMTDTAGQNPGGQISAADVVSPLTSKMLFWRARYVQRSEVLYHLPFLFWLVEATRPTRIVVLGVDDAVAHFALCQAVDKLDLATRCHGIGDWPTVHDAAAPVATGAVPSEVSPGVPAEVPAEVPGQVPADISAYNAAHYPDFSVIEALDQRALLARTAPASVDLLYVNLVVTSQLADALTYAWPTKLSPRGIMLLHGTDTQFDAPAAQEFLTQIQQTRQTISFSAGQGLLAVLWGPDQPYRLTGLAKRAGLGASQSGGQSGPETHDPAADAEIKLIFTRLGLLHRLEWEGPHEARQHQIAASALTLAQTDLQTTQTALADLHTAYAARGLKTASYQVRVHDLEQEKVALAQVQATLDQLTENHAILKDDHASLAGDHTMLAGDYALLAGDRDQLAVQIGQLRADMARREAEAQIQLQTQLQAQTAIHAAHLIQREAEWQAQLQSDQTHLQDIMALTAALSQVQAEKHALIEAARPKRLPLAVPADPAVPADLVLQPTRRKTGLLARVKAAARRALRRALRPGRSADPDAAPGLLTRFKRSGLMAPVRAVVRRIRRRRKDARMRAG